MSKKLVADDMVVVVVVMVMFLECAKSVAAVFEDKRCGIAVKAVGREAGMRKNMFDERYVMGTCTEKLRTC